MRSMTGFGSARAEDRERVFTVEIRSVNHRFCEVRSHLPHDLAGLEAALEARVRKQIDRGRIDVSIDVAHGPGAVVLPRVDFARARGYRDALAALANDLGIEGTVPLELIASAPGIVRFTAAAEDAEALLASVEPAMEAAMRDLLRMREKEGAALRAELGRRLAQVVQTIDEIQSLVPKANEEKKERLGLRLAELIGDRNIDGARLAQEVAVLVDRADVTEELARLRSHAVQFRALLDSGDAVGRKLDFMLQEMHREANTIGSKTASAQISHLVVALKSELERAREQVQNVE
jgi:uncharacterized protein (TIGR00255 family)